MSRRSERGRGKGTGGPASTLADTAQIPAEPGRTCFRLIEPEDREQPPGPEASEHRHEPAAREPAPAAARAQSGRTAPPTMRLATGASRSRCSQPKIPAHAPARRHLVTRRKAFPVPGPPAGQPPEEELLAGLGGAPALPQLKRRPTRRRASGCRPGHAGGIQLPSSQSGPLLSVPGSACCCRTGAPRPPRLKLSTKSRARRDIRDRRQSACTTWSIFRYDLGSATRSLDPDELAELAR